MVTQWFNELAPVLPLNGEWEFSLAGQNGLIRVPGTWEAQGYRRDVDGPAVYGLQVSIPAAWRGQTIQLQFDAVSYHVEVEINGMVTGSHTGLWTPFAFDITPSIRPGEHNQIRLTVYKPGEHFPMRECLAGFLPDVCRSFGGVWQNVRLVAFPSAAISDVFIAANADSGTVIVKATLHHAAGLAAAVHIHAPDGSQAAGWRSMVMDREITAQLSVAGVQRWRPESPALYRAEITLADAAGHVVARIQRSFGFRALSHEAGGLLLNDIPVFLRGVLNWGWYPEIFCPAPDEATIRDEFRRVRSFGYNMVKLCLMIPAPWYFDIADQEGMLLWLELPMWVPQVSERFRRQVPQEYADILARVQHHPSIVIYSLGCELSAVVDTRLLRQLDTLLRDRTAGVLVCDNSGSGEAYGGLTFDYADFNDYHFYAELHYFNPLLDHFRRDWRPARPWIFGEFCDADDFRDLNDIAAAHQGELPWWLVEQPPVHPLSHIAYSQQSARMPGLEIPFDGQALQRISRQQSFVVRKTILEKVRARASMGGYVVTGLRDTPIATSAMFDDLGRAKYEAAAFGEFNADTVLLLEQGRRRAWKHGGDRPRPVDRNNHTAGSIIDFRLVLAQTGKALPAGNIQWRLLDAKRHVVRSGTTAYAEKPAGHIPAEIASIAFTAPDTDSAQEYTLQVELNGDIRNHWPLWVYPAVTQWPEGIAIYDPAGELASLDDLTQGAKQIFSPARADTPVLLCGAFTAEVENYLQRGGRAMVLQTGAGSLPVRPCPFWREAIKLLYDHPILEKFPHRKYVDLQFYHLATDYALDTDRIAALLADVRQIRPVIRRLDARQFTLLDYLVELRIGQGILLASTLRFGGGAGDQVQGLQYNIAGRHLLALIMAYLLALR